jgi:trimeric autotransporter adhesin
MIPRGEAAMQSSPPITSPGARRVSIRLIATVLILSTIGVATAPAETVVPGLWGTNGSVEAITRIGDRLYIGGGFSTVGPITGGGVPVDRTSGAPRRPFAPVTGSVRAAVPDGDGGWFIGGVFTAVGGVPRSNLAHVLADGSVADWDPGVAGTGAYMRDPYLSFHPVAVEAMVLRGHVLYVGGRFSSVGGRSRSHLAAVDVQTGIAIDWAPEADNEVRCLALDAGVVYVGGDFTSLGGVPRHNLAAVRSRTAEVSDWDPDPRVAYMGESRIRSLSVDARTVYVGGDFDRIGGAQRNSVAAIDVATGRATTWDAGLTPPRMYIAHGDWVWPCVSAIAVRGRSVYLGGAFTEAGGALRPALAVVDARTGIAEAFDPQIQDGGVSAIDLAGNTLYVAGALYGIGGAIRPNLAALDARTGAATSWNPRADGPASTVAAAGDVVFVGGGFRSIFDWQVRYAVAALDLSTGALAPWDAKMDGWVSSLAALGDTLYMVGAFRTVGGQTRGNIAAVDARTGAVLPWAPGSTGMGYPLVPRLAAQRGVVYVAGSFVPAGGDKGQNFAALDGTTGAPVAWASALAIDGSTESVLPVGDVIYLSGHFGRVGGQARSGLAALDASTGAVLPWGPRLSAAPQFALFPDVMALVGDTLYIGGSLGAVEGQMRSDLAAVNARTGTTLPWDPRVDGDYPAMNSVHVTALAARGNTVWAGGKFSSVGSVARPFLAAIDGTTGRASDWTPDPNGDVRALFVSGDTLFVGGAFRAFDGLPSGGLAAITLDGGAVRPDLSRRPARPLRAGIELDDAVPNPSRTSSVIRFALREETRVSLTVFDVQGRRAASLLDDAVLPAGDHEAILRTAGWAPGLYLYRLETAGSVLARKLVVTR